MEENQRKRRKENKDGAEGKPSPAEGKQNCIFCRKFRFSKRLGFESGSGLLTLLFAAARREVRAKLATIPHPTTAAYSTPF
jgi:hypothetical protein